jgi:predicted nuclease of predicted toxin-antitoxin system
MAGDRGRLLADENFPEPVSRELRSRGYDVDRVRRHGKDKWASRLSDAMVQQIAKNGHQIILTQDKDFRDAVNQIAGHRGIIWCAVTLDFRVLADKIDSFLRANKRAMKCSLVIVPIYGEPYYFDPPQP